MYWKWSKLTAPTSRKNRLVVGILYALYSLVMFMAGWTHSYMQSLCMEHRLWLCVSVCLSVASPTNCWLFYTACAAWESGNYRQLSSWRCWKIWSLLKDMIESAKIRFHWIHILFESNGSVSRCRFVTLSQIIQLWYNTYHLHAVTNWLLEVDDEWKVSKTVMIKVMHFWLPPFHKQM